MRAVAESDAARVALGEERLAAYRSALERDTAPAPPARVQVIESAAMWWFSMAVSQFEQEDLETALQQAQVSAGQFMACAAAAGEADLDAVSSCAREVDAGHPLAQMVP